MVAAFLLFVIVGGYFFAICRIATAGDHDRVLSLLSDVESNYAFKTIDKDGSGRSIYVAGLSYSDNLSIHGVYSDQEVAAILRTITEAQARRGDKKTIRVKFYSDESDNNLYKEAKIPK